MPVFDDLQAESRNLKILRLKVSQKRRNHWEKSVPILGRIYIQFQKF